MYFTGSLQFNTEGVVGCGCANAFFDYSGSGGALAGPKPRASGSVAGCLKTDIDLTVTIISGSLAVTKAPVSTQPDLAITVDPFAESPLVVSTGLASNIDLLGLDGMIAVMVSPTQGLGLAFDMPGTYIKSLPLFMDLAGSYYTLGARELSVTARWGGATGPVISTGWIWVESAVH